eukprot:scaffold56152_cov61-Phaeocystis_antarctica.AAC.2
MPPAVTKRRLLSISAFRVKRPVMPPSPKLFLTNVTRAAGRAAARAIRAATTRSDRSRRRSTCRPCNVRQKKLPGT